MVAHGSTTLPATALATLGLSRPFVYRQISDSLFWAPTPARRARVRFALHRAAYVVALWEGSARVLMERFGVAPERLYVVPNGVRISEWRLPSDAEREGARLRLGLPRERPVVAFVGALVEEKGPDLAVETIAASPGVHLLVVGSGPQEARIRALAARLLDSRATFLSSTDRIRDVYTATDVLLFPSRGGDSMPAVVIEAGLMGVPTVATDTGALRTMIVPGKTGEVVATLDPLLLARTLQPLITDSSRRRAMGSAARDDFLRRFDTDVLAQQWAGVLSATQGAGEAPRPVRSQGVDSDTLDYQGKHVTTLLKQAALRSLGEEPARIEWSRPLRRPSSSLFAADLLSADGERARVWVKRFAGRNDIGEVVQFSEAAWQRTREVGRVDVARVLAYDISSRTMVTRHVDGLPLRSLAGARLMLRRGRLEEATRALGACIRALEMDAGPAGHETRSWEQQLARLNGGVKRTERAVGSSAAALLEATYSSALQEIGEHATRRVHGDLSPSNVLLDASGQVGVIDPSALIRFPMYDVATLVGRLWAMRPVPSYVVEQVLRALVDGYQPDQMELRCLAIESLHRLVLMALVTAPSGKTHSRARRSLARAIAARRAPWLPPSLAIGATDG